MQCDVVQTSSVWKGWIPDSCSSSPFHLNFNLIQGL